MCGIYGRWNRRGAPIDTAALQQATRSLRHRGPDDEGYLLVDPAHGDALHCRGSETDPRIGAPDVAASGAEARTLALGFRRLSILDLSPAGHQPMPSPDGAAWIVFNGEVYNYVELREELRGLGHTFRSGADTEVILAAYREWGEGCLHRFNGMWAFAIWDERARTLLVARDRFGVKPLYYVDTPSTFAFASEAKALVGAQGEAFRPSAEAVYEFLAIGILPSPTEGGTFFQGVRSLPPGHLLRVTRDAVEASRYYAPPSHSAPEAADPRDAVEEYRELLTDAVRLRLRSDVPVGSCLSGGLDSSSIVCLVDRLLRADASGSAAVGERQQAFSAVYDTDGPYNERRHVDAVLAATRAEGNFTVPTVERFIDEAERMVWHQDEPTLSTSIFAQWSVMSRVRERGVTVLLDGQGADEVLAGYRPYDIFLGDLLRRGRIRNAVRELNSAHEVAGLGRGALLARSLARQLPEAATLGLRRARNRRRAGPLRGHLAGMRSSSPLTGGGNDLQSYLGESLTEGLPHLLRHEDRSSMAFSIEARVPFMDYRVVEFALTRTAGLRIRGGWTKWILREAMRDVLPPEIAWRRDKVGFATPETEWLRAWLRRTPDFFGDAARSGEYLELPAVRREVQSWLERGGDSRRVWRWMNLELWLKAWEGK